MKKVSGYRKSLRAQGFALSRGISRDVVPLP
jgi:hypothetical protein